MSINLNRKLNVTLFLRKFFLICILLKVVNNWRIFKLKHNTMVLLKSPFEIVVGLKRRLPTDWLAIVNFAARQNNETNQ